MADRPQSFEHHAKIVFGYHRVAFFSILIFLAWAGPAFLEQRDFQHFAFLCLGIAVTAFGLYARLFATGNQDRLIRLEERLRMKALLPDDLQARIPEFTTRQLVALRFASDAELPSLARQVLDEGISESKRIKSLIRDWRPDHQRI